MRHRHAKNPRKGISSLSKGKHQAPWTEIDPNLAGALHDAVIHRMVR